MQKVKRDKPRTDRRTNRRMDGPIHGPTQWLTESYMWIKKFRKIKQKLSYRSCTLHFLTSCCIHFPQTLNREKIMLDFVQSAIWKSNYGCVTWQGYTWNTDWVQIASLFCHDAMRRRFFFSIEVLQRESRKIHVFSIFLQCNQILSKKKMRPFSHLTRLATPAFQRRRSHKKADQREQEKLHIWCFRKRWSWNVKIKSFL